MTHKALRLAGLACLFVVFAAPGGHAPPGARVSAFRVEITGIGGALFKKVSGLGSESDVVEFRDGNDATGAVHRLPGRSKYPNLVLQRVFTGERDLWTWRQAVVEGRLDKRSGTVTLLDATGVALARWSFHRAWPVKYKAPDLDASKNEVAIETLELVHEGLVLE